LTKDEVKEIAEILLKQVSVRLGDRNLSFKLTDAFKDRLVDEGYDPRYGARPMRRAISRLVEDHLAEAILSGKLKDGDTVVFDIDKDGEIVTLPEREPALAGVSK